MSAANAELHGQGVRTFDDLYILALGEHYGLLNAQDLTLLNTPDVAALVADWMTSQPRVDESAVRNMLRASGHGGGHMGIDVVDGRLLAVFDLLALRVPATLSQLAFVRDPSHVLERWSAGFWPRTQAMARAIIDALIVRDTALSAVAAGALIARAGSAYLANQRLGFRLFVPRSGAKHVLVRILGTVAVSAIYVPAGANGQRRWRRYVGLIQTLAKRLLDTTDAVLDLNGANEERFQRFFGAFAILHASASAISRARDRASAALSSMFGPLESLSVMDREITDIDLYWAALIAQHLPMTLSRFRRLKDGIQCDRLVRAISVQDYNFERARLIKLAAVALTVNDSAVKSAALGVCARLAALPPGTDEVSLQYLTALFPALAACPIPAK